MQVSKRNDHSVLRFYSLFLIEIIMFRTINSIISRRDGCSIVVITIIFNNYFNICFIIILIILIKLFSMLIRLIATLLLMYSLNY